MKKFLLICIDVFMCSLLNYWGFLILESAAEHPPSEGFGEVFWIFNTLLILFYLLTSYSLPTLVLSLFHVVFLIGSIVYFNASNLLIPILIQISAFTLFIFYWKDKERIFKLKPLVFVLVFMWLIVLRSLV